MGQYVQVRLVPYEDRHVDPVFQAVRESIPEVSRWMWWCHSGYSLAESKTWVETSAESFRMKTSFEFVVESHDGQVLGCCGLNALDLVNQRCNLGYWTRTSAANRGVATEAVSALVDWAFRETKLVRLEIIAAVDNSASRRVAEKSNAYAEGILRSRLLVHGQFHDAAIYSIIKVKPHAA